MLPVDAIAGAGFAPCRSRYATPDVTKELCRYVTISSRQPLDAYGV